MGPLGVGGALVDLLQQLLLHLADGVDVEHLGGQRLALVHASALGQHVEILGGGHGAAGHSLFSGVSALASEPAPVGKG